MATKTLEIHEEPELYLLRLAHKIVYLEYNIDADRQKLKAASRALSAFHLNGMRPVAFHQKKIIAFARRTHIGRELVKEGIIMAIINDRMLVQLTADFRRILENFKKQTEMADFVLHRPSQFTKMDQSRYEKRLKEYFEFFDTKVARWNADVQWLNDFDLHEHMLRAVEIGTRMNIIKRDYEGYKETKRQRGESVEVDSSDDEGSSLSDDDDGLARDPELESSDEDTGDVTGLPGGWRMLNDSSSDDEDLAKDSHLKERDNDDDTSMKAKVVIHGNIRKKNIM